MNQFVSSSGVKGIIALVLLTSALTITAIGISRRQTTFRSSTQAAQPACNSYTYSTTLYTYDYAYPLVLSRVSDIAIDDHDHLYAALLDPSGSTQYNRVDKFNFQTNTWATIVPGGNWSEPATMIPQSIHSQFNGLYVADRANNTVKEFIGDRDTYDPLMLSTTIYYPTTSISPYLNSIAYTSRDTSGFGPYVFGTYSSNRVVRFNVQGGGITLDTTTNGSAIGGVDVDAQRNLYFANKSANSVGKITYNSSTATTFIASTAPQPHAITLDSNNNLFVSSCQNGSVSKYSPTGNLITTFGSYGTGASTFSQSYNSEVGCPSAIALASNGDVYVADYLGSKIIKFVCADPTPTPIPTSPTPLPITPTPTATQLFCTDSDGDSPQTPGTITTNDPQAGFTTFSDVCYANGRSVTNCFGSGCIVQEGLCLGTSPFINPVSCPQGCLNGACTGVTPTPPANPTPTPTPYCFDTDGGNTPTLQGTRVYFDGTNTVAETDSCLYTDNTGLHNVTSCPAADPNCQLDEFFCLDSQGSVATVDCPLGCTNGACISATPTPPAGQTSTTVQFTLQGITTNRHDITVHLLFTDSATQTTFERTVLASSSTNGTYTTTLLVPSASYSIQLKGPSHLGTTISQTISGQNTTIVFPAPALAGDVHPNQHFPTTSGNPDNTIQLGDVAAFLSVWNSSVVNLSNNDTREIFDLNLDNQLDAQDLALLINNWTSPIVYGQ